MGTSPTNRPSLAVVFLAAVAAILAAMTGQVQSAARMWAVGAEQFGPPA